MKRYWIRYECCDANGCYMCHKDEDVYAIDLADLFDQVQDIKESFETMYHYVRVEEIEEDEE